MRIVCGCSLVLQGENGDGRNLDFAGECELCYSNGGLYSLSPHYVEVKPPDAALNAAEDADSNVLRLRLPNRDDGQQDRRNAKQRKKDRQAAAANRGQAG